MTYVQVETGPLTDRQVSRIRLFSRQGTRGESIRIRLSPKQLNGGGTTFLVTKRDCDKMTVAKAENKSVMIQLSLNWIKENQRKGFYQKLTDGHMKRSQQSGEGAFAAALGAELAPSIIEVGKDIFSSIFGSGQDPTTKDQKLEAIKVLSEPGVIDKVQDAKDPEELKKVIDQVAEFTIGSGQSGSGQSGAGWKDALLWAGAFLNPFGAITGPLLVNAKIAQKALGKGMKGKEEETSGSGLKFY